MKNLLKYTGIGVLGILFVVLMGCEKEPSPTSFTTHDNIPHGTVETQLIPAVYVGETTRDAKVYLPPGFATSGLQYPVVYLLHGFGGDENSWLDSYNVNEVVDWLIYNDQIDPMVIVMPDASNALGGSFFTNSIDASATGFNPLDPNTWLGFGLFEWYMVGAPGAEGVDPASVVGYIETVAYAARIDTSKRAIIGHSMGGYGAMKLALLHPSLFKAVASHSGPLALSQLLDAADSNVLYRIANVENPGQYMVDLTAASADQAGHALTLTMFGLASAFSPHFNIPSTYDTYMHSVGYHPDTTDLNQYMVSETPVDTGGVGPMDDIYPGVDLPIIFWGGNTEIDSSVWNLWLAQDVYTLIAMPTINPMYTIDLTAFGQLAIYFDCGTEDDFDPTDDVVGFGLISHSQVFSVLLDSKGIEYTYEAYTGSHSSTVYYRLDNSLGFISNAF